MEQQGQRSPPKTGRPTTTGQYKKKRPPIECIIFGASLLFAVFFSPSRALQPIQSGLGCTAPPSLNHHHPRRRPSPQCLAKWIVVVHSSTRYIICCTFCWPVLPPCHPSPYSVVRSYLHHCCMPAPLNMPPFPWRPSLAVLSFVLWRRDKFRRRSSSGSVDASDLFKYSRHGKQTTMAEQRVTEAAARTTRCDYIFVQRNSSSGL